MVHSFNAELAQRYGIEAAVIIWNLDYWISHNRANDTNKHDDKYWTYNSSRAFAELFPYLSAQKIKRILTKLKDEGVIETGNYNKVAYDRTLWYTFTDAFLQTDKCNLNYCTMDSTGLNNGKVESVPPIPDIKPDIKPINKDIVLFPFQDPVKNGIPYKEIITYLNEQAETNYLHTTASHRKWIHARWDDLKKGGYTDDKLLQAFKTVVDNKVDDWFTDPKFCKLLRPSTLFGTKFEGYLSE